MFGVVFFFFYSKTVSSRSNAFLHKSFGVSKLEVTMTTCQPLKVTTVEGTISTMRKMFLVSVSECLSFSTAF